jgi:hypothetical protein
LSWHPKADKSERNWIVREDANNDRRTAASSITIRLPRRHG